MHAAVHPCLRTAGLAGLLLALIAALLAAPAPSADATVVVDGPGVVIDNGTIQLGVNPEGHLNVDTPESVSLSGSGATGLRYLGTNAEATAPGCLCEGWGAAGIVPADPDAGFPGDSFSGYANVDSDGGANNLEVLEFTSTPTSVVSTTLIVQDPDFSHGPGGGDGDGGGGEILLSPADGGDGPDPRNQAGAAAPAEGTAPAAVGDPFLQVTHDYHPADATADLYEATVTITNVSDATVEPRYRRTMDWDVEPTPFSELVTIQAPGDVTNLLDSGNNGFSTADPLGYEGDWITGPPHAPSFTDAGPDDHGARFDFGFDPLAPGESVTFSIYYGAAADETAALAAVDAVGAEVYSLGQTSLEEGFLLGEPNTFIFAFGGVGGDPDSVGTDGRAPLSLGVRQTPRTLPPGGGDSFDVAADIKNIGDGPATGIQAEITLGADLALPEGASATADLADLDPDGTASTGWTVVPTSSCNDVATSYSVSVRFFDGVEDQVRTVNRPLTIPGTCGSAQGVVRDADTATPLPGAPIQVCGLGGTGCVDLAETDGFGRYFLGNMAAGSYQLQAFSPECTDICWNENTITFDVGVGQDVRNDVLLTRIPPTPTDATIEPSDPGWYGDIPVVYWRNPLLLSNIGCEGGVGAYTIVAVPGTAVVSGGAVTYPAPGTVLNSPWDGTPLTGVMTERVDVPGLYTANLEPFFRDSANYIHDGVLINMSIDCPLGDDETTELNIYIDPSGNVYDVDTGAPIAGATVVLQQLVGADFVDVPDGSAIMSPTNRTNPDLTDAAGHFGWDTIAGTYRVLTSKTGCWDPSSADRSDTVVSSREVTVPPPVTDLVMELDCNAAPTISAGPDRTGTVGAPIGLLGTATDLESDALTVAWSTTDGTCTFADAADLTTTITCTSPGSRTASLSVSDGVNTAVVDTAKVTTTEVVAGAKCPGYEADPRNQVVGTPGNDKLKGTKGADIICGLGGNDTLTGGDGDDLILGGDGDDTINGGGGNDTVLAGDGKDKVNGSAGNDTIFGGHGNDSLSGAGGNDTILGEHGNDTLRGHAGDDALNGGVGDDLLVGGDGSDVLEGGSGNDRLYGNEMDDTLTGANGKDVLRGGDGDDTLFGGNNDDTLDGGAGVDTLTGQGGTDRCVAEPGEVVKTCET